MSDNTNTNDAIQLPTGALFTPVIPYEGTHEATVIKAECRSSKNGSDYINVRCNLGHRTVDAPMWFSTPKAIEASTQAMLETFGVTESELDEDKIVATCDKLAGMKCSVNIKRQDEDYNGKPQYRIFVNPLKSTTTNGFSIKKIKASFAEDAADATF